MRFTERKKNHVFIPLQEEAYEKLKESLKGRRKSQAIRMK